MKKIHMVFGAQGAGKSTYAQKLARQVNGLYLSIDEWMWALYSPDLPQPLNIQWVMERVARCEKQIWAVAKQGAICGTSVVLDLGFMKVKSREQFMLLATDNNIPVQLHFVDAPYPVRHKRVMDRNTQKGNTFSFEITPQQFDFMEKEFERPTEAELEQALIIYTGDVPLV